MCEKGRSLSVTVDTSDVVVLLEVGRMFAAIATCGLDARASLGGDFSARQVAAAVEEHKHTGGPDAGEAFSHVDEPGAVDAGAAFAHATEGATLNGTTAGPAGPGVSAEPAGLGTASPANLTPVNTGAAAGPAPELDKNGLPWDARINTSNKAKTGPGVWKRAPKLTDEQYNAVLNELRATMNGAPAAPAGTTAPPPGPGANAAAPPPPAGPGAGTPPGPGAAAAPAETVPTTFPDFLAAISKRTTCNPPKLTKEEMDTGLMVVGATYGCALGTLADLNHRPDLIPAVYEQFASVWNAKP